MSWSAIVYGELRLSIKDEEKWRALEVSAEAWQDWPEDEFYPDQAESVRVGAVFDELAGYDKDAWVRIERKGERLIVFGRLHEDAYGELATVLATAVRAAEKVGASGDVYLSDFQMIDFVWRIHVADGKSSISEADFETSSKTILPKALDRLEKNDAQPDGA
jgi:hypothetical protein